MHVFFDTVWKLHPGEIPEKPPFHFNPEIAEKAVVRYNEAIAAIKQNALIVGNPEIITTDEIPGIVGEPYKPGEFYFWPGSYELDHKCKEIAILTLPEEKKNTMENMTKEQANLIRLINDGLSELHTKQVEYTECAVSGNPNWEYFKGKADAYEYAYKTFKRILEWTASGSVAAPKEEEKSTKNNPKWHIKVLKDRLAESEKQYNELESKNTALRETLKELLPIAQELTSALINAGLFKRSHEQVTPIIKQYQAIIERARKLISK